MLALALSLATAACSATWTPDAATHAEPGQALLAWSDPATCETLVVTSAHKRAEGLRATLVTFRPDGRVGGRVVLPKTMWPSDAVVDAPRRRVLLVSAASGAGATQLRLESRRFGDFSLERSFGSAGVVTLEAPRLKNTGASTGSEARVVVDARGRLHVAVTSDSVGADTALYAWRLLPDGRVDPAWQSTGTPVSRHTNTNSGELAVALTPEGQLLVGAGAKLRAQLFRFTLDGALDPAFGTEGRVLPREATAARVLAPTPGGGARFVAFAREQQLVTVSPTGAVARPLTWSFHAERNEFPFALLLLPDGRALVAARSFDLTAQRASLALTLWQADGRLDGRFGKDGLLEVDEPEVNLQGAAATLDAAGNLLVAGRRSVPREAFDGPLFLMRFPLPPPGPPAPARPDAVGEAPRAMTSRPVEQPPTTAPPPEVTPPAPPAPAAGVYVYVDDQGVETWVDSLEQVPQKFRSKARQHAP